MNLFDAHNHIHLDPSWTKDRQICAMNICATQEMDWSKLINLQNPSTSIALGTHPWWASTFSENSLTALELLLQQNPQALVGEIGLDAIKAKQGKALSLTEQEHIFKSQLTLAQKYQRPIILHCVKAWPTLKPLLQNLSIPFLYHRFSGSWYLLQEVISIGGKVSLHPQSFLHQETVCALEKVKTSQYQSFVVETDFENNGNFKSCLEESQIKLAKIWQIPITEVNKILWENSCSFFAFSSTSRVGKTITT